MWRVSRVRHCENLYGMVSVTAENWSLTSSCNCGNSTTWSGISTGIGSSPAPCLSCTKAMMKKPPLSNGPATPLMLKWLISPIRRFQISLITKVSRIVDQIVAMFLDWIISYDYWRNLQQALCPPLELFRVRSVSYCFHPRLWEILCGIWMRAYYCCGFFLAMPNNYVGWSARYRSIFSWYW